MVRLKDVKTRKKEENDLENPFVSQCHMVDCIGVRIDQRLVIRCQTSIDETKDDLYISLGTREKGILFLLPRLDLLQPYHSALHPTRRNRITSPSSFAPC
ncbi:hypothetical protein Goari_017304, partial [Gossypium aridum]|nr:hypothetical protein [Gossypium aridum]